MSTGTANNRRIKAMSKKFFGGPHVPVPCWSGRGPPVLHHPLGVPRQSNQSSPPGLPRRHLGRLTDWDQPSCDLRRHSTALHQQHWLQPKVIQSAPSSSTPAQGRAVFEGWRSVMASGPATGLGP